MFRHYRVILRELVISTLLSYTSMWMQLLVTKFKIFKIWNLKFKIISPTNFKNFKLLPTKNIQIYVKHNI